MAVQPRRRRRRSSCASSTPRTVLRLIETHRVTHAQFVPTMFVRMLKLPDAVRESYDVSSLAVRDPRGRAVPGGRQAPDDGVVRPDHPRVLRRHRGIRRHHDRARGVARPSRLGRQADVTAVHVVGDDGTGAARRRVGRALLRGRTRRSSTSRIRRRPRRSPTSAVGGRWATWATSTRTATCTSPTGRRS